MVRDGQAVRANRAVGGGKLDAVLVMALVALCAAVVAGLAWTRPTTTTSVVAYQQSGRLSYSAPTAATSIYGAAGLSTGQPIYLREVPNVQVSYAYRLASSAPTEVSGTEQLVVHMSNGVGISRTIPLQPVTQFHGSGFAATGTLPVSALKTLASAFAQASGSVDQSETYTVAILPTVHVRGQLGHSPIRTDFDPSASFRYSATMLAPVSPPAEAATSPSSGAPDKQFTLSAGGSVNVPGGAPNTLFLGLSVLDMRVASLVVLAAALAAGILLGLPMLKEVTSDDERVRIAARPGTSLIEIDALPESPSLVVVQLSSFSGLDQVARRLECPLLHLNGVRGDTYAVVDNGTIYRFSLKSSRRQTVGRRVSGSGDAARHAAADQSSVASPIQISSGEG
ncbi:MAG: hypothetical protein ACRDY3_06330 [Acidimicrobiales bacterium]